MRHTEPHAHYEPRTWNQISSTQLPSLSSLLGVHSTERKRLWGQFTQKLCVSRTSEISSAFNSVGTVRTDLDDQKPSTENDQKNSTNLSPEARPFICGITSTRILSRAARRPSLWNSHFRGFGKSTPNAFTHDPARVNKQLPDSTHSHGFTSYCGSSSRESSCSTPAQKFNVKRSRSSSDSNEGTCSEIQAYNSLSKVHRSPDFYDRENIPVENSEEKILFESEDVNESSVACKEPEEAKMSCNFSIISAKSCCSELSSSESTSADIAVMLKSGSSVLSVSGENGFLKTFASTPSYSVKNDAACCEDAKADAAYLEKQTVHISSRESQKFDFSDAEFPEAYHNATEYAAEEKEFTGVETKWVEETNHLLPPCYGAEHVQDDKKSSKLSKFILQSIVNQTAGISLQKKGKGHLAVSKGDMLHERYKVLEKLGQGGFSTVYLAQENVNNVHVAIKVSKCAVSVRKLAKIEMDLLKYIHEKLNRSEEVDFSMEKEYMGSCPIIRVLDTFDYQRNRETFSCMVMPVYQSSLLTVIEDHLRRQIRLSSSQLRYRKSVIRSVVTALMHLERINVVHTDLKPENLLLVCSNKWTSMRKGNSERGQRKNDFYTAILADFGLSLLLEPGKFCTRSLCVRTPGRAENPGITLQTREYRSPEIILQGPITTRMDVWSLGCLVYELITGRYLFDPKKGLHSETRIDVKHIAMMMELLGPLPSSFTTLKTTPVAKIFKCGDFKYSHKVKLSRDLTEELQAFVSKTEAEKCTDFIMSCLEYDPSVRTSALHLLGHTWLS